MQQRWIAVLVIMALAVGGGAFAADAQIVDDPSQSTPLGIGLNLTAPFAPPDTFPASGLVGRFWIADLFGVEGHVFVVGGVPSFAARGFVKFFNSPFVDLYVGSGAAFFTSSGTFVTPLQATTGIEVRLTDQLALVSEVGLMFRGVSTVTAGLGMQVYF